MATRRATGSRSTGSVLRDLAERLGLVGARLGGEAEDPLPDDVALDLLGATADADAPLAEELLLPEPVLVRAGTGEHRVGSLDRERQVAVTGGVLGDRELRDRALGPEGPAGTRRDLGSLPEPLEDLEPGVRGGEPLADVGVVGPAVVAGHLDIVPEPETHAAADERPLAHER